MGNATARVVVEGQTAFTQDGGAQFLHHEQTIITNGRVVTQLTGMGEGCRDVEPVIRYDPAVVAYEREKAHKRSLSAYANRPITPIFKTRQDRLGAAKRKREAINVPSTAFEIDPSDD